MKINWKQKLSSRKFWALSAAVAVSCILAFGGSSETIESVTGVISAVGACMVYILAEGAVDQNRKGDENDV